MRKAPQNNEGFTLIEIIMALAILGLSLFILLETQFSSLNLFSDSQDVVTQNMLMDQAIAQAEIEILTGEEEGDGNFGDEYEGYAYAFESELVDEIEFPGLVEVKLTLFYGILEEDVIFRIYDGRQQIDGQ